MSKTAGSHMLHTFTDVHDAYSLVYICDFNASTDPVHREDCYAMVSSSAMTEIISRTSIARTKQAALTHNVMGKEINL